MKKKEKVMKSEEKVRAKSMKEAEHKVYTGI